jgi:hypothetical protein
MSNLFDLPAVVEHTRRFLGDDREALTADQALLGKW